MPAEKALCLTIISGKPDDVSSEDWEKHIDDEQVRLTKPLIDKYHILRWTKTYTNDATRKLLQEIPHIKDQETLDADVITNVVFKHVNDLKNLMSDPAFLDKVQPHLDQYPKSVRKTKVTIGYVKKHAHKDVPDQRQIQVV